MIDPPPILVAEDEFLIAMDLTAMRQKLGFGVDVVSTVEEARSAAETKDFAAAIVDYDLHGETTEAVTHALELRGVPYIIATGMSREDILTVDSSRMLPKPYNFDDVRAAILDLMVAKRRECDGPRA